MLEAVGHPYAVNPDRALRKEALQRDWPVLVFTRPVRLRDRFAGVSLPQPTHAGRGRDGRRRRHRRAWCGSPRAGGARPGSGCRVSVARHAALPSAVR